MITEVRAGKREGSIVSARTVDSIARRDQATWEELRRELEDIGISPLVITEKRQFIIAWFEEAVAAGKLDEDPFDDDPSNYDSVNDVEDPPNNGPSDYGRLNDEDDDSQEAVRDEQDEVEPKSKSNTFSHKDAVSNLSE